MRAEEISQLLGQTVRGLGKLQGGSLSEIWRAELSDGTPVIVKNAKGVDREAQMLRALASARVRVPEVYAASNSLMVMEDISPIRGMQSLADWRALADLLALLRQSRSETYGWPEDHAFNTVEIVNEIDLNWPRFWAEKRLIGPAETLDSALRARINSLAGRMDDVLPQTPPAALLHGDFWAGNAVMLDTGQAALIDPACYYGDQWVDLAMMDLFASPPSQFWEAAGVDRVDWPTLRAVYQLWPIIVHIRLFGESYRAMLEDRLRFLGA
ncbi:MAG: fructosamine kinase family protein [Pseudomonadota bacterium]